MSAAAEHENLSHSEFWRPKRCGHGVDCNRDSQPVAPRAQCGWEGGYRLLSSSRGLATRPDGHGYSQWLCQCQKKNKMADIHVLNQIGIVGYDHGFWLMQIAKEQFDWETVEIARFCNRWLIDFAIFQLMKTRLFSPATVQKVGVDSARNECLILHDLLVKWNRRFDPLHNKLIQGPPHH